MKKKSLKTKFDHKSCLFVALLMMFPFFVFSQVQLVSLDATKIYPDDTRITYMQVSDYPIDNDFLQFVEKEVLTNTLIQRFSLSKNGGTCFFHSHKDITEEMIVEAINEAYYLYFTTETYKTKKENHSKVFNQNNPDKLISKEDFDKFTEKERAGIPISKDEYEEAVARKKNEKSNEKENNKKFISQANIKPISALNQIKWEKGGIYEGFSPKDEILEKRTQNTKHFQKDNGNIVAQIGGNYHYQDENNLWQDIDFTITKTNANGFAYSNITNTVKTYFPESAGDKGVSISDKSMDIKIWKNPELLIYDANKNILHKESSLNNSAKVKDNIAQY